MALKKRVQSNTTAVKKNSDKSETVLENGVHVDVSQKIGSKSNTQGTVVGLSLGGTFNLENYESLRVDCWLSDTVKDGETVEEAYARIKGVLSEQFVSTVAEYKED